MTAATWIFISRARFEVLTPPARAAFYVYVYEVRAFETSTRPKMGGKAGEDVEVKVVEGRTTVT